MSTRFYLRSSGASWTTLPTGENNPSDSDYFPSVPSDKNTVKNMIRTGKGGSQTSVSGSYNNGGVVRKTLARIWATPALATGQTITINSTHTFAAAIEESSASQNLAARWFAYLWHETDGYIEPLFTAASCVEHGADEVGCVKTYTKTSKSYTTADDKVHIIAELWFDLANTKSVAYTATGYYEGTTDPVEATATSDAASYYEASDTLQLKAVSTSKTSDIRFLKRVTAPLTSDVRYRRTELLTRTCDVKFGSGAASYTIPLPSDIRFLKRVTVEMPSSVRFRRTELLQPVSDLRFRATVLRTLDSMARFVKTVSTSLDSLIRFKGSPRVDLACDVRYKGHVLLERYCMVRFGTEPEPPAEGQQGSQMTWWWWHGG